MFVPRSLAKRPSKPAPYRPYTSTVIAGLAPTANAAAGPSNARKRSTETDESSSSDGTSSDDDSDKDDSSGSDSGSGSDSSSEEKPPVSALTEPKVKKDLNATNRQQQTQSEIAARLELALSDVSLWRNEHLYRRLMETQDWYLPFSRLHDHPLLAPFLENAIDRVPDASLVSALRAHGSGAFEYRIKIRMPSNAAWKDKAQAQGSAGWVGAAGGYEVRCKAWVGREEGWMDVLAGVEEREWNARMVYVEHVPSAIRSLWAFYHYITALARACLPEDADPSSQIVYDVSIPTAEPTVAEPSYDATQRFRGQAFVVFSSADIAKAFCARWAWNPSREQSRSGEVSEGQASGSWNAEGAMAAAVSSGFRSVSKTRWDKLKAEYLEHQTRILRQAPKQRPPRPTNGQTSSSNHPEPPATRVFVEPPRFRTAHPLPFPPGILVFARRLHPETNKTTLKVLFGRAFPSGSRDVIEYLDFQKGIDSAHIRLRTPSDASTLATYFSTYPLAQRDGLDAEGQPAKKEDAVEVEVVLGTREENYWGKVPEKVRMAAVERAGLGDGGGEKGGDGGGSRRKRQRKG